MDNNDNIIETFLKQMSTQDNRATAAPYFYVIMNGYDQLVPEGHGGSTKYYYEHFERAFDSVGEAQAHAGEDYTDEEFEELKCVEYEIERKFEEHHMFLTEQDADNHFKLNRYHYTHDAHVFLKHAWRAPYLEEFFNALFDKYNIKRWSK